MNTLLGTNRKKSKSIGVALLALAMTCTMASAGNEKLSSDLQSRNSSADAEVIVQYKVVPTDAHHRKVGALGGTLHGKMEHIKAGHYTVPASALQILSEDPDVAFISPNRSLKGMMDIPAATVNAAAAVAAGYDGKGIGVAVIDSGIRTMSELPNIVYAAGNFMHSAYSPDDAWGHGTHVAGLIGSNGEGTVYTGVVPNVNLISLRVLDRNGNGTDAGVIGAINAAISLKSTYNIRVINLSLGRPVFEAAAQDPLCQAVEAAWKAGIVVVVAAGNEGRNNSSGTLGYGTIASPGNDPYVITVGAMKDNHTSTRTDDLIASYSSKGPTLFDHYAKPDILAPGNKVVSTMRSGAQLLALYPQNVVIHNEYTLSGTSMATPLVSGAVVALIQKNPGLTPDQVKARLMKTASKTFPVSSTAVDPNTGKIYTSQYDIF
ncbi:MAG: S8 family peptidase, partial [Acidobacteriota bacterium]|nr:S8 family peptidase [Acidobacteriota bacterium]